MGAGICDLCLVCTESEESVKYVKYEKPRILFQSRHKNLHQFMGFHQGLDGDQFNKEI